MIADDSQWLDRSSLDVLTFIARRLDNEPVVFIAGLRDGFSTALEEAGLPILQLGACPHPIPRRCSIASHRGCPRMCTAAS